MKRIRNLLIATVLIATLLTIFSGCCSGNHVDAVDDLQMVSTYELVSIKAESQTQVSGELSGAYVICFGNMSGELETINTFVYQYCYKREDGGIVPVIMDMSSYEHPETVKVVIYEDDAATPKVEIWRNSNAQNFGDGEYPIRRSSNMTTLTEFRFTVPSGSMVNSYDLQGLTE